MNPVLYALCKKAVIGPTLWITGQCAFPPPLPETPIKLDATGLVLLQEFHVPVTTDYFLSLSAEFSSIDDRLSDRLIGSRYDVPCYGAGARPLPNTLSAQQQDLGTPVRLHVTALKAQDDTAVWSSDIASLCSAGHDLRRKKTQVLSLVNLPEGRYRLKVHNVEARPDLAAVALSLTIHPGGK